MSKHSGKIGLYLLLIVALIAGYLYLNDQVSTQGSYTMGQLEKALEEDKVTDAVIHQNREVPTGYVTANIVSDGQKTVYVTDVKEAEALLEEHDIDPTIRNVPKDSSMIGTVLPVVLTGAILLFFFMMMNRQMSGGGPGGCNGKNQKERMDAPPPQQGLAGGQQCDADHLQQLSAGHRGGDAAAYPAHFQQDGAAGGH